MVEILANEMLKLALLLGRRREWRGEAAGGMHADRRSKKEKVREDEASPSAIQQLATSPCCEAEAGSEHA